MQRVVMKFGGTSLGIAANLARALGLIESRLARDTHAPVVVVSALSGATDLLVRFADSPAERAMLADTFSERHRAHAEATGLPGALDAALADWRVRAAAAGGSAMGAAARDALLASGELLSATLVAAALTARGVAARAWHAGRAGLVTDDRHGAAHPLPASRARLAAALPPAREVAVVTGFVGQTEDGHTTTLGRGGSDFSAAWIGAALAVDEIEIWTDTSGMLSADPRVVAEARPVPELSFTEASELAYFGAKVLHPKTMLPAIERGIPVRVLNTARPQDTGTRITADAAAPTGTWWVKSIASRSGITAITIVSSRMLMAHGFLARVFEVFARHHLVVDLVTTSEVSISVTLDDAHGIDAALADLEGIGEVEVRRGLAIVAVVGDGAPTQVGLAGHVFTLLGSISVPIEMISQGASRVNLSFVVREEHAAPAMRLLHGGLGLDAGGLPGASTVSKNLPPVVFPHTSPESGRSH